MVRIQVESELGLFMRLIYAPNEYDKINYNYSMLGIVFCVFVLFFIPALAYYRLTDLSFEEGSYGDYIASCAMLYLAPLLILMFVKESIYKHRYKEWIIKTFDLTDESLRATCPMKGEQKYPHDAMIRITHARFGNLLILDYNSGEQVILFCRHGEKYTFNKIKDFLYKVNNKAKRQSVWL